MNHRLFRVYFETSALNAMRDRMDIGDAIATKAHLNVKGKGWYISPIVLWEILATKNQLEREKLIFFAQHLCEEDLFPSPEEIIVKYIELGFPPVEPEHEFVSRGMFSVPWRDICRIKDKTLMYSADDHARMTKIMRDIGRQFHQFHVNGHVDIQKDEQSAFMQVRVIELMRRHGIVDAELFEDKEALKVLILVGFYVLMFLCAGASIDRGPVTAFWDRLGIHKTEERIEYAFSTLKPLFVRGPLMAMASMTIVQAIAKSNRGVVFDCMHSIYAIYADMFLSNDEHFRQFRKHALNAHKLSLRIHMLDEVAIKTEIRSIPPRRSFIDGG